MSIRKRWSTVLDGGARITHRSQTATYDYLRELAQSEEIAAQPPGVTVSVYLAENGHWALYETLSFDELRGP